MYEKYSVLFVDDEVNILNAIRREMFDEEFNMFFANSGKEALEIINKNDISVIVSDMRMPEMNGLELLKTVEEKSPMIVKMVLSGYTQIPQILATVNQIDIQKFIPKPWIAEEFISMIHKSLDLYIIKEENSNNKKMLKKQNESYKNILKKINSVIETAKINSELVCAFGKRLVSFGEDFSVAENAFYKEILDTKVKIFDILSLFITNEKKTISTKIFEELINKEFHKTFPDITIKTKTNNAPVDIDIIYFESIIKILITIFYTEFKENGVYINIDFNENFKVTIICPNIKLPKKDIKTVLEMKFTYFSSIFDGLLDKYGIECDLMNSNNNLVAVLNTKIEDDK